MRRILTFMTPIMLAAALMATTGAAEPTIQLLADGCATCHRSFDADAETTKKQDDFDPDKFIEEMREIKYETGKGRIMGPIAKGLSDQQIVGLAEYLQQLKQ